MTLLEFSLLLTVYYTLHSLLAANGVKAALMKLISQRYYRLFYNLLALGLFLVMLVLYLLMEKKLLWESNLLISIIGIALTLAGIAWSVTAMKRYNMNEFTGLEQLKTNQKPVHSKLIIRGLNGRVRHPLYFGTLLIVWGILLIFPTEAMLSFALISTIYIIIGSRLEEEKLVGQFGEAYRRYQREVPMLLPFNVLKKIK